MSFEGIFFLFQGGPGTREMLPPALSWLPGGKAHRPPLPLRAAPLPPRTHRDQGQGYTRGPVTRWAGAQWAPARWTGESQGRERIRAESADPAQCQSSSLGAGSIPSPRLLSPTPSPLASCWAHEQGCHLLLATTAREVEETEAPHLQSHRPHSASRGQGQGQGD